MPVLPTLPAFVLAVTALMLIPGPNVALIVANSVAYGRRYGLLTVAGTSAAVVVQLGLSGFGMAGVLGSLGHGFAWVRWSRTQIRLTMPECGSGLPFYPARFSPAQAHSFATPPRTVAT